MKITAHLHYSKNYTGNKFELWPCKIETGTNNMFIKTLELDIPDVGIPTQEEITSWLVTGLRKEKETVLAETHAKIAKIDDQIQQLLCLPAPQMEVNP